MLKVVGASTEQTRISSYVLAALSICGIFIIIFGGKIKSYEEEDGIYSATVYWKDRLGYRLEFWGQSNSLVEIPKGSARAYYNSDIYLNGWSKLEIETNEFDPDWVQAQSAGLLEGSLTWQHIYYHWQNTINTICESSGDECDRIRELIKTNSDNIRDMSMQLSETDPFWHQIRLYYAQLDGIEMGWRYAVKRSLQNYDIPAEDFIWMNVFDDITDLTEIIDKKPTLTSAVFKLTNTSTEQMIHVAHHTGGYYRTMLRTIKHYRFNYHYSDSQRKLIPGTILTFTSYPGVISSLDDFYLINSLTVTGTTLNINSTTDHLDNNKVFTSIRVMVANRLASSGRDWFKTFSHNMIDTNNKQWIVLDNTKLDKNKTDEKQKEGLLFLIEQVPGIIRGMDITKLLQKHTFWASFGSIYFNDTNEILKYDTKENLEYYESPRGQQFKMCKENCDTLKNLLYVIQEGVPVSQNNYGARGDLYTENSKPYGIIDSKYFTSTTSGIKNFEIQSGPVYSSDDGSLINKDEVLKQKIRPYKWSSNTFNDISHVGQPDIWNFKPIQPTWVWI